MKRDTIVKFCTTQDLTSNDKIQKDRAKILSDIETKAEKKKKAQLKMDM